MVKKGYKQLLEHKIKRGLYKPKTFTEQWKQNISKAKKGKNLKFQRGELRPIVYCSICGTMKVVKPSRVQYYDNFLCSKECKSIFYTGYKWSEESKKKRSIGAKLMWEREGFREKYHYLRGKENFWFGKKMPKELRDKMSASAKIRANTEEFKARQREVRLHQVFPTKDSKPERIMQIALSLEGVKYTKHVPLKGQPDIFIKPNNCIFVDGDHWHANPKTHTPNTIVTRYGKRNSAKEIWKKDKEINNNLKTKGYYVIRVWATEILKDAGKVAKKIITLIEKNQHKTDTNV